MIHRGKCLLSAGPCLRSSAGDHSLPLAAEKKHKESPQHRWHWPNHKPPAAANGTNQNLRAKWINKGEKQFMIDSLHKIFIQPQTPRYYTSKGIKCIPKILNKLIFHMLFSSYLRWLRAKQKTLDYLLFPLLPHTSVSAVRAHQLLLFCQKWLHL